MFVIGNYYKNSAYVHLTNNLSNYEVNVYLSNATFIPQRADTTLQNITYVVWSYRHISGHVHRYHRQLSNRYTQI